MTVALRQLIIGIAKEKYAFFFQRCYPFTSSRNMVPFLKTKILLSTQKLLEVFQDDAQAIRACLNRQHTASALKTDRRRVEPGTSGSVRSDATGDRLEEPGNACVI